ncbi:uncharacterized protein B0H18DRAFT_41246 [Fomitopsis serialis]|uniref:uncharacterized protein n=1 Tax=Fomitopsis serialis TaxID=139415 RepID=UPI00200744ED|nr:uncharacterized protein B0H18DRAFT_41246 [Neoantrodia serialis]KAH9917267.1 hypothetical protein B0H18DRAFT_41246 [Neoantrodia serialis]
MPHPPTRSRASLYREVNLQHVSRVGSLHQALTNSSRRASLVSVFRMQANGTFAPVLPLVNEILLVLTNLAHLSITLCGQSQLHNPALYTTMLRTLARCTFKLTSLKSGVVRDRDFVHFLRQQTRLESLHIGGSDWDIPQDALPNLKYVKTYQASSCGTYEALTRSHTSICS